MRSEAVSALSRVCIHVQRRCYTAIISAVPCIVLHVLGIATLKFGTEVMRSRLREGSILDVGKLAGGLVQRSLSIEFCSIILDWRKVRTREASEDVHLRLRPQLFGLPTLLVLRPSLRPSSPFQLPLRVS